MKRREIIILLSTILFDLVTKLTAKLVLPFHEFYDVVGQTISLYLTYNDGFLSGQADAMLQQVDNKNHAMVLSSINWLLMVIYFWLVRKVNILNAYKILIAIALFSLLTYSVNYSYPLFFSVAISSWVASAFSKLIGLAVFGSLFYVCRDIWIRLSLLLIIAGGIGNLLSHFYSPYSVIDFIYIEGSYDLLRIGVFNFADVSFDVGVISLFFSLCIFGIKKVKNSSRGLDENKDIIAGRGASS